MSKAYEFLKECGIFYVLTVNGDYPAGRPFGVVMEVGDDLYISTNDRNQAHKQLRENSHVQIIAKKTRDGSGSALPVLPTNALMLLCAGRCTRKTRSCRSTTKHPNPSIS